MNLKIKSSLKFALLSPVLITPLVVASCSNQSNLVEANQPTKVVDKINANVFKLDEFTTQQALEKIDNNLIFLNRNILFKNHQIDNLNQVNLVDKKIISNDSILVKIELAANSYYDAQGNLGSTSKTFAFVIQGFKTDQNQTNPEADKIQKFLNELVAQATFDVDNKSNLFASNVSEDQIIWKEANSNSKIQFSAFNLNADDVNGRLGFSALFSYDNISSFVEIELNSNRAISGFKIKDNSQINDQREVAAEILRLKNLNQQNQLLKPNLKFSVEQIQKFIVDPNSFKTNLINLNNSFNYEIQSFLLSNLQTLKNNKTPATINLLVSKNSTSQTVGLSFNLEIENNWSDDTKPPFLDADFVALHELSRLKVLTNKLKLNQTIFTLDEVAKLKAKPNEILKLLRGFVPEQYFQYKVENLNITNNRNGEGIQTLTFKIKARLWRDNSLTKKEVESDQFSFHINVVDTSLAAKPPTDLSKTWKVESKNGEENDIEVDFKNQFDLAHILVKEGNGQIEVDGTKFDAFLRKVANEKPETFFKITGDLPSDWSWDNYLEGFNPEINETGGKKNGLSGMMFLQYADSSKLSENLNVNFEFKNMKYTESLVAAEPTNEEQFNNFKNNFETNVKKQVKLDANAIASGRAGVFQFANLNEKNFLSFTNMDWEALIKPTQNKVKISAQNVKFNYLKNTIEFNWNLSGSGDWSAFQWSDNAVTTLRFEPSNETKDKFSKSSSIAELNLGTNALLLNDKLSKFTINPYFVSEKDQQEKLTSFGLNWTWKARELATFLRFTFYQAFDDQASELNIGLVPKNGQQFNFNDLNNNFKNYDVVLKAKLKFNNTQETFNPYFQLFGSSFGSAQRTYQTGDIITLKLNINDILQNPIVFGDANEILPGLGQGITLGSGLGAQQAAMDQLQRTDLWSAQLATYVMSLEVNGTQVASQFAVHRFVSFNLLNRHEFKDPFWPEPTDSGWVSNLEF